MSRSIFMIVFALVIAQSEHSYAATTTLNPMADAWVFSSSPTTNFGGSTIQLSVSCSTPGTGLGRSFLKFNVSSIPSGSTINSVNFRVNSTRTNIPTGSTNVLLQSVGGTWTETCTSGITWNNQPAANNSWSASKSIANNATGWHEWNSANYSALRTQVQNWVNGTTNNGFLLWFQTESGSDKDITWRNRNDATLGPQLVVDYTPPPSGDLNVTVTNQNNVTVSGATVERYTSGGSFIDQKTTNGSGLASWSNLSIASYTLRVLYNGEFWVGQLIALVANQPNAVTLRRKEPYANNFKVFSGSTDVTGQTVPVGTKLFFSISVQNDTTGSRSVRVNLSVDRDQSSPYDFTTTTSGTIAAGGGTVFGTIDYAPAVTGTFSRMFGVEILVNGAWQKTDSWPWGTAFVVPSPILTSGRVAFHRDSNNQSLHSSVNSDDGQVCIYNVNTGGVQVASADRSIGNCMNPAFSPDGAFLAFMAIPSGQNLTWENMRIYVLDLAEDILTTPSVGQDPKFAQNGLSLVFKKDDPATGYPQIWRVNRDGTSVQRLTASAGEKSGPNYSLDGTRIVFWLNARELADVWWMNSDGSGSIGLVQTSNVQDYYPIFRDATRILFSRWESTTDHHDKIFQINTSTAQIDRLPLNLTGVEDADPFPASSLIGFSSSRINGVGGGYDLYVAAADGTNAQELIATSSSLGELGGSYSPYQHSRKLRLPTIANNLTAGSQVTLTLRAFSDGGVWSGATPSITFTGPLTQAFLDFRDDGSAGDEVPGDGIYSRSITLPAQTGNYSVVAKAVSFDNGFQNNIVSESTTIRLDSPGSLRVILSPQAAVDAGAQWRRVGTSPWFNSNVTEPNIIPDSYFIEYKSISGWNSPPNRNVTIGNGQLVSINDAYVRQTGSLQMTLSPQAAVDAGAKWRRVGTQDWFGSGIEEPNVPTNSYDVEFLPVDGWITPTNKSVTVTAGSVTQDAASYARVTQSAVWVNFGWVGPEAGTQSQPFNTLAEGIEGVSLGGTISIQFDGTTNGQTSETATITKAMTLTASGGMIHVGVPSSRSVVAPRAEVIGTSPEDSQPQSPSDEEETDRGAPPLPISTVVVAAALLVLGVLAIGALTRASKGKRRL